MRRSPGPDERQRDAERTRQQLLDAAVIEFGAHGFGGARVSEIAARAGVNKQLISYYFGGKEGLYKAVADRWRAGEPDIAADAESLGEVVAAYARTSIAQPDLLRLLVREAVDRDTSALDPEGQRARFQSMLDDFRQRQTDGELAANLDAAYTGLALFGLAAAPVVFPQIARALGLDPDSEEFAAKYAEETARLVEHLKED
ncbi:TetR/AcrR family transcriptional regulator [Kribbella sp. NPDC058693]|uniref:TetR family transcriptional regulator n=1 Tax=Kribbella jiaozuonensis TaxID=2575441 RepID=A0A4U3M3E7_9ACTN|nr:TetR family transcriptional regulator [Kribbella jiaozuonensis]TKK79141.1 TetR family transcriptional regulator [Kribbella jiaozuonensis]TKK83211.1 TetR family transcriptional regulator [Kribbella jiaozuonensis]